MSAPPKISTDPAPTPEQVLDDLVRRFAPPRHPDLPFFNTELAAKEKLVARLVVHTFGNDHALSKIVSAYTAYLTKPVVAQDELEQQLDAITVSYEHMAAQINLELDSRAV